jgi:GNAT superfamily N-acetyltransferase
MQSFTRLVELSEDWRNLIQRDGWRATWAALWQEFRRLPYQHTRLVVVARSLLEPVPNLLPKIALEIHPFEYSDIDMIGDITNPSEVRLCARRLKSGHEGVLALVQGKPVAYSWGCTAKDPKLDWDRPDMLPTDVLFVGDYTVSTFRGQGIQTALTLMRLRLFRDQGYLRAIACIQPHNNASRAVYKKVGSREIGMVDYQRLGPWRRIDFIEK